MGKVSTKYVSTYFFRNDLEVFQSEQNVSLAIRIERAKSEFPPFCTLLRKEYLPLSEFENFTPQNDKSTKLFANFKYSQNGK